MKRWKVNNNTTEAERDLRRRHTLSGCMSKIYNSQRINSKIRGHGLLPYNKYELIDWVLKQPQAWTVYERWKLSNYDINLTPSIDRIEDDLGYSFDNIRIITWEDNRAKEWIRKEKPIILVHKKTKGEFKFNSIKEACEKFDLNSGAISNVLRGDSKSTGGFYIKTIKK